MISVILETLSKPKGIEKSVRVSDVSTESLRKNIGAGERAAAAAAGAGAIILAGVLIL